MPRFNGIPVDEKKPRFSGAAIESPSVVEDVVKAIGAGAARGTADLVATPSNIGDLLQAGLGWVTDKALGTSTREDTSKFYADRNKGINEAIGFNLFPEDGGSLMGSQNLRRGLSYLTGGGTDYQPETTAGEYARTIGEFAPSMALSPGNMVQKAVQAVVPAVTSETAGQLTDDTDLEPYARIIGALGGGIAANKIASPSVAKTPSAAEIKRQYGDVYETQIKPALKQVEVEPSAHKKIVDAMRGSVDDDLVDEVHGPLISFLDRQQGKVPDVNLIGPQPQGANATMWDIEKMRRGANHIGSSNLMNKSQAALSGKVVDALDDAAGSLGPSDLRVASGVDVDKAMETLSTAREGWKTGIKAQIIEDAIEKAQNAASGFENGLRIEFRKLLNGKNARQFNETELNAIKTVSRGTLTQNALRWFGGFGVPTDSGRNFMGSVAGMLTGNAIGGPAGAAALTGAGTAAKAGASGIASRNADIVDALVKSGSGGQEAFKAIVNAQTEARRMAIARALLQSSIAYKTGEPVAR